MKFIALLSLATGLIFTVFASAQDSVVREETQFEDWLVQCVTQGDNPKQCAALTRATSATEDRDLAIISIQQVPEGQVDGSSVFRAFLTIPTNVLIQPGIVVEIDLEQASLAQYEACTQQNCRASFQLSNSLVSKMTSALGAALILTDIRGGEQRASFSLAGFSAALDKLAESDS